MGDQYEYIGPVAQEEKGAVALPISVQRCLAPDKSSNNWPYNYNNFKGIFELHVVERVE